MGFQSWQMWVAVMYHSCFSTFACIEKVDWSTKAQEIDDKAILSHFIFRFSQNVNLVNLKPKWNSTLSAVVFNVAL